MTMDPIEEQLKNALQRQEPRAGFADRVEARIAAQASRGRRWYAFPQLRWALAFLLLVAIFGGVMYRRGQEERARGELAKHQAVIALRLAGAKIQLAEAKVRHLSE